MELIKTHYNLQGYIDSRIGGRAENQDSRGFADTPHGLLVVVCDGMGGGPSGKMASTIAVQATIDYVIRVRDENVPRDKVLKDAVEFAHNAIIDRQRTDPSTRGMGTTLTALLVNSHSAYVAHVGDSRVYQFRGGRMVFRTRDHSFVGEQVQNGVISEEQARLSGNSNIITRCLGGKGESEAEIDGPLPYLKGDRFMLCTDGIWGMMPEPELIKLVAKTPSLSGAADATIIAVDEKGRNEGNHHDNLTIALLDTTDDSILKVPMSKTSKNIIYVLAALLALSLLFNFIQASKSGSDKDNQQKIEELQAQLQQSKDSINFLRGRIQGNKEKGPDLNVYMGDSGKESQKGKPDSTKSAPEAKPANDKANQADNGDIAQLFNQIISQLQAAKATKEVKQREKVCKQVVGELARLSAKDPAHKAVYDWAIQELEKPKTLQPGADGEGQINAVIMKLKNK